MQVRVSEGFRLLEVGVLREDFIFFGIKIACERWTKRAKMRGFRV